MNKYTITVNGQKYHVTVKSILGNKALVDVDGWEFEVDIENGNSEREIPAKPTSQPSTTQAPITPEPSSQPAPKEESRKRASHIEASTLSKPHIPAPTDKRIVAAHLPGLILEILVKPGDKVKAGETVIKMEAMKMVNEIKSKVEGTVKEVLVKMHDNVLENQPLMIIE